MCGITGFFTREKPIHPSDEERINHVLNKLSYRGPDGSEIWKSEKAVLGHRRLSIIDLSSAGTQPFEIAELGLVITFNGEIYNFQELRQTLVSKGYSFRSHSDTEVILLAYDCYGAEFLQYLRGMFAFCLFDQKKNLVLFARDPAGEKPLYYYFDSHRLIFSSEIKAFHAFPEIDLPIDVEAVKSFFTLQYVPGTNSVYTTIKRLPAGSVIELNLNTWNFSQKRYWCLERNSGHHPTTPEEIDELISESVKYRLVADVEVGLLLSGGIDSALLAAYASANGAKVRVFTARFDEENLDESKYAQQVARHLDLEQITVTGGQLTPEIYDRVIYHGDELLGDPACVPTFFLSKEISRHVKVVLSGEGADELFWGYDTYRLERIWRWLSWSRDFFSQGRRFQSMISAWEISPNVPAILTRFGKLLSSSYDIGASRWTSVFADHTVKSLIPISSKNGHLVYLQEMEQRIDQLQEFMGSFTGNLSGDLLFWLADNLLMKVDRMTMAHGVEARAPFLDPHLILKALALPQNQKIHNKQGKYILRMLVEKHYPGSVGRSLAWRKKHGFEVPVDRWLQKNLKECVEDRLSPSSLAKSGLFDVDFVAKVKNAYNSSSVNTSLRRKLWLLLCFQTWYEFHEQGFGFH